MKYGFEIQIREISLRRFGFEKRISSNFAEFKIRIQDSRLWRQNLRFGFEMRGESVESANLKIRSSLLICRTYISTSLFWVILPDHETSYKYIGFPFTIITVQLTKYWSTSMDTFEILTKFISPHIQSCRSFQNTQKIYRECLKD